VCIVLALDWYIKNRPISVKLPRMAGWFSVAVILLAANALLQPEHFGELLFKLNLVAIAAVMAYWIDREIAPYARPHSFLSAGDGAGNPPGISQAVLFAAVQLRRALVFGAVMIGLTLGA
jgi:hypothetical protein